ncbi:MAG: putative metalloprotease CJM1_0395 family protein [Pseudomonadota bacterium]
MEGLAVTFSAAGRPLLTTRVRSLIVDRAAGGQVIPFRPGDAAQRAGDVPGPRAPRVDAPSDVKEVGGGFAAEARRNAVISNLAPGGDTPAVQGAEEKKIESADGLTDAEREQVKKLKARDAEVRRHEQAHAAVGGQYASAPTYTFQLGPDGRRYAIGGEVKIDIAPVPGDPEATIDKMTVVKAAALAPAEPSAADRRVASLADAQRLEAVAELAQQRSEERFEVFAETKSDGSAVETDPATAAPADRRLADASSLLAQGEDTLPGQEMNIAA